MEIEQQLLQFLSTYGYWVIFPLMVIEGPGVTMLAAFLAATGIFSVPVVFILSLMGDVVGDVILYGIGYKWGMGFVRHIGKYIGITEKLVTTMKGYFDRHGGKTVFAVKSTTGLCWATFTAAGIVKMDFWKFVTYSILGGIIWSGTLVAVGYFYGYLWQEIAQYIKYAGWVIGGIAIATFVFMNLYKKRKSQGLFQKDGNGE